MSLNKRRYFTSYYSKFLRSKFIVLLTLIFTISFQAQDFPDKIRGYKVHREKISVQNTGENADSKGDFRVEFDFGEPKLDDFSALGITLELGGKITVFGQSGTVDFISFKDFKVNGIVVEIEEYKESFDFKKNELLELKKPIKIFVSTGQALRGAAKEWRESKEKWKISGKVFVFGRFQKFGFRFKRVIPVEIDLEIDNPIKTVNEDA